MPIVSFCRSKLDSGLSSVTVALVFGSTHLHIGDTSIYTDSTEESTISRKLFTDRSRFIFFYCFSGTSQNGAHEESRMNSRDGGACAFCVTSRVQT